MKFLKTNAILEGHNGNIPAHHVVLILPGLKNNFKVMDLRSRSISKSLKDEKLFDELEPFDKRIAVYLNEVFTLKLEAAVGISNNDVKEVIVRPADSNRFFEELILASLANSEFVDSRNIDNDNMMINVDRTSDNILNLADTIIGKLEQRKSTPLP